MTLTKVYAAGVAEKIKLASAALNAEIMPSYLQFFTTLLKVVKSLEGEEDGPEGNAGSPMIVAEYGRGAEARWASNSMSWSHTKNAYDALGYYHGITGKTKVAAPNAGQQGAYMKVRGKGKKKAKPRPTTTPFVSYLGTLPGQEKLLLGELVIEYAFNGANREMVIYYVDNVADIEDLVIYSSKTGKEMSLPSKFTLTVSVLGFQNLIGGKSPPTRGKKGRAAYDRSGKYDEWTVVDRLAKLSGGEAQWRKINSRSNFGRGRRPIKAIIAPIMSWWFREIAKPALTDFSNRLAKK